MSQTLSYDLEDQYPTCNGAARQASLARMDLRAEHTRELLKHWLHIAGDAVVPWKSSLDPSAIKASLPYLLIYEMHNRTDIRYRLFGTALYRAFGKDLTGRNYLDYVGPDRREATSERLFTVTGQPCGLYSRIVGPAGSGVLGLYESVGLPLRAPDGSIRFSVHISQLVERGLKSQGAYDDLLTVRESAFLDIGAGIPDASPPT